MGSTDTLCWLDSILGGSAPDQEREDFLEAMDHMYDCECRLCKRYWEIINEGAEDEA